MYINQPEHRIHPSFFFWGEGGGGSNLKTPRPTPPPPPRWLPRPPPPQRLPQRLFLRGLGRLRGAGAQVRELQRLPARARGCTPGSSRRFFVRLFQGDDKKCPQDVQSASCPLFVGEDIEQTTRRFLFFCLTFFLGGDMSSNQTQFVMFLGGRGFLAPSRLQVERRWKIV